MSAQVGAIKLVVQAVKTGEISQESIQTAVDRVFLLGLSISIILRSSSSSSSSSTKLTYGILRLEKSSKLTSARQSQQIVPRLFQSRNKLHWHQEYTQKAWLWSEAKKGSFPFPRTLEQKLYAKSWSAQFECNRVKIAMRLLLLWSTHANSETRFS